MTREVQERNVVYNCAFWFESHPVTHMHGNPELIETFPVEQYVRTQMSENRLARILSSPYSTKLV